MSARSARPSILTLLALCWCAATGAAAALDASAGDERFGWILVPFDDKGGILHALPADEAPGTVRRALALPSRPILAASDDGSLVLAFRAESAAAPDAYQFRRITAAARRAGSAPLVSDPGALPPLTDAGALIGLASVRAGVVALLTPARGGALVLKRLQRTGWEPLEPPATLGAHRRLWIVAIGSDLVLIAQSVDGAARRWTLTDPESSPPAWTESPVYLPPETESVLGVGDQLVGVSAPRGEEGVRTISLLRTEGALPLTTTAGIEAETRWIVPVGRTVALVAMTGQAPQIRLDCRVVTLSGQTLHEGPALTVAPVDRREVEAITVLMLSVIATVGVFILRPAGSYRTAVALPEGAALAEPWRRVVSGAADFALAALVASALWRVPITETLHLSDLRATRYGVWPLVSSLAVMALVSAFCEAFWGRTPGKAVLRCRTIGPTGGRPSLVQALARNAVKVFCPPLALVSLITPGATHPAAFGTLVVIDAPPPADAPPG